MPRPYPRERPPASAAEATFPFDPEKAAAPAAAKKESSVPPVALWPHALRRFITFELRRRALEPYGADEQKGWEQLLASTYAGRTIDRLGMKQIIPQSATAENLYELALADAKAWDAKQRAG